MNTKQSKRPKRDQSVTVLVTAQEKESYEQAGVNADLSMSDWIRRTLNAEVRKLASESKRPD